MVWPRRSFVGFFCSFSFFSVFCSLQVVLGWLKVGVESCGILAFGRPLWVVCERKLQHSLKFSVLPTTFFFFFSFFQFRYIMSHDSVVLGIPKSKYSLKTQHNDEKRSKKGILSLILKNLVNTRLLILKNLVNTRLVSIIKKKKKKDFKSIR